MIYAMTYCLRCKKDLTTYVFRDKNEIDDFKRFGLCPDCLLDTKGDDNV